MRRTHGGPGGGQARAAGEPATLARLLGPARAHYPLRGAPITRPGTMLKHEIPIRTFAEWTDARPGFLEVDLVAHCGSRSEGFFLCTLCAVDIATAWVDLEPVWGKGHARVGGAVHRVRTRLPMPLVGLDSDNGSEFINRALLDYCRLHRVTFTRSRPGKKNDSAHVEQKNGAVVRQLVGYDRAQTPYQRLCAPGVLSAEARRELEALRILEAFMPSPPATALRQIGCQHGVEHGAIWPIAPSGRGP